MKIRSYSKSLFLVLSLFVCMKSFSQDAEFFLSGKKKFDLKDYYSAINDFTNAIEATKFDFDQNSRNKILNNPAKRKVIADYFLYRGYSKNAIGDFEGAEKDFFNVAWLLPLSPLGHFEAGKAYYQLGMYSLSIFKLSEAIKIDSTAAEMFFWRGLAKFELASPTSKKDKLLDGPNTHNGNYEDAINDFTKSLKISCCIFGPYFYRGMARSKSGDSKGALADFDEALEINPDHAWALQERGLLKSMNGDYYEAMKDLTASLNISPNARSYRIRGNVKLELEDFHGSILDCDESILLDSKFPAAYYTRGLAKIQLKQLNSACLDLSKAGELGFKEAYSDIIKYCNR
jgi:tetratricopeptide (TPR) repeat protein